MDLKNKKYYIILLIFILVFSIIFISEKKENFTTSNTTNVDLPLTTTFSCNNMCGSTSRCYITGQQCLSDNDCPGCQPFESPLSYSSDIIGENDSGNLTGLHPSYSSLTTDIGTQAALINKNATPAMADFGLNTWSSKFNQSSKFFDKRYKPNNLKFMPKYPEQYTTTGLFMVDGPLASNY
jgi:hypothetical protein